MQSGAVSPSSASGGPLDAAAPRMRWFSSDEASVQRIPGWNIHCLQITAGTLDGQSVDLHLPSIQVLFEEYRNVSTGHSGTAPTGAVIFGIAKGMKGRGRLNGIPWSDGVSAFDSRRELDSIVPPAELISLVVGRQVLKEYAWHTEHVDLEDWLSEGPMVLNDARLAQRLAWRLLEMKTACQNGSLSAEGSAVQQRLMHDVLETLGPLVSEHLCRQGAARRELAHVDVVRRARGYVQEHADEPLQILALCRALGVSRRWLQWSFNEVMGIGPMAYLRIMRLNGARRMLLGAAPGTKVKDAVEAYGFWHLSRFSRDYRRHFGELPSQTLHRALAR
jgi:AraC family ethanolamine operon transcriptional activator